MTMWQLVHTVSQLKVPPLWAHLAPGHPQQRRWETIIFSAPKAVVEISEAAGAKTQPQLAVICSLAAGRVATDIPLGSTPATGAAVLGSPMA